MIQSTVMSDINLGNCERCPTVMLLLSESERAKHFSATLAEQAMAPELDDILAPMMFEAIGENDETILDGLDGEPIANPADLAKALRKSTGVIMGKIEDHSDQLVDDAAELSANCLGPLKMHAAKAGRKIMATVCNSPAISNGVGCEHVHIFRTTE